nr:CAP domain-containing protein [Ktedonobacterales bacterium]
MRRISGALGFVAAGLVAMLLVQLLVIHGMQTRQTVARGVAPPSPTTVPTVKVSPSPTPARSQPTPVPTSIQSDFITRAIARTNMYRVKYAPTCPQLRYNAQLTLAAYRHSADMALHGFLNHNGSDGSTIPQRLSAAGYHYTTWAENVTWYKAIPEQAVDAWFNETPPNDGH